MMRTIRYTFVFLLLFPATFSFAQPVCIPVNLQCEHLTDPLGIDATLPRLSWKLQDVRTGVTVTGAWNTIPRSSA